MHCELANSCDCDTHCCQQCKLRSRHPDLPGCLSYLAHQRKALNTKLYQQRVVQGISESLLYISIRGTSSLYTVQTFSMVCAPSCCPSFLLLQVPVTVCSPSESLYSSCCFSSAFGLRENSSSPCRRP